MTARIKTFRSVITGCLFITSPAVDRIDLLACAPAKIKISGIFTCRIIRFVAKLNQLGGFFIQFCGLFIEFFYKGRRVGRFFLGGIQPLLIFLAHRSPVILILGGSFFLGGFAHGLSGSLFISIGLGLLLFQCPLRFRRDLLLSVNPLVLRHFIHILVLGLKLFLDRLFLFRGRRTRKFALLFGFVERLLAFRLIFDVAFLVVQFFFQSLDRIWFRVKRVIEFLLRGKRFFAGLFDLLICLGLRGSSLFDFFHVHVPQFRGELHCLHDDDQRAKRHDETGHRRFGGGATGSGGFRSRPNRR